MKNMANSLFYEPFFYIPLPQALLSTSHSTLFPCPARPQRYHFRHRTLTCPLTRTFSPFSTSAINLRSDYGSKPSFCEEIFPSFFYIWIFLTNFSDNNPLQFSNNLKRSTNYVKV